MQPLIKYIERVKLNEFALRAPSEKSDNAKHKLDAYNYYSNQTVAQLPSDLICQFTGESFKRHLVNCSHIFQSRWFAERGIIDLADIHDPKNLFLLFKPFEVLFDEGRIVFLWEKATGKFKMKVLDPSILQKTLLDLACKQFPTEYTPTSSVPPIFNSTMNDLIGSELKFPSGVSPYRRCFAFHTSRALYEAVNIRKWPVKEDDFPLDDDAWSPGILELPELKSYIDSWMDKVVDPDN